MATAVVVAGGRSTRFGDEDKAVADLAGTPMIRRVADRVAPAVDELVVNCREEQVPAVRRALSGHVHEPTFAVDEDPDRGPLAGIRDGLRAASDSYGFVVACDMPLVNPDLAAHLLDRARGRDAAIPRVGGEWFEPTQAAYRTDAMADACDAALARGDGRIVAAAFDLDYVVVEGAEIREHATLDSFENVNTRAELREAAERL
jgi:molybdopterin-guanine dinucleotide biosynthesis protein A